MVKNFQIVQKKWSCVKDNKTGLFWEAKTKEHGLHFYSRQFTWYDSNPLTNGGFAGIYSDSVNDNTEVFSKKTNKESLCGRTDWHLPKIDQMMGLSDPSRGQVSVDAKYFPNLINGHYQSSSLIPGTEKKGVWSWVFVGKRDVFSNTKYPGNKGYSRYAVLVSKGETGTVKLVDINFTLRTKNQYGKDRQFKKKDYNVGNYNFDFNDQYIRDTFSTTALVRSISQKDKKKVTQESWREIF